MTDTDPPGELPLTDVAQALYDRAGRPPRAGGRRPGRR